MTSENNVHNALLQKSVRIYIFLTPTEQEPLVEVIALL